MPGVRDTFARGNFLEEKEREKESVTRGKGGALSLEKNISSRGNNEILSYVGGPRNPGRREGFNENQKRMGRGGEKGRSLSRLSRGHKGSAAATRLSWRSSAKGYRWQKMRGRVI